MAEIERGHISDIELDSKNANKGTVRGRGVLEQSIRKHGAGRSLVLDRNKKAIAGNHAAEVFSELGIEDVVFVHTTGREVVAVVRDDLDLDAEGDVAARELAVYDNRAGELGLSWDAANLSAVMEQSQDVKRLFTPGEAARIMAASEGEAKKFLMIPLLFAPDELADMEAAWDELSRSAKERGAEGQWWIARFADYDRIMNGASDVMNERKLRYIHQALAYLIKFWRKHRNEEAGE